MTVQDVRYGLRTFKRNPFFFVTAILAATLGIGGASAVFSAVDRVLFRALPYTDSDRLVSVGMMAPLDTHEFVLPEWYFQLRRMSGPFTGVTAYQAGTITTDLTEDRPARLSALRVEANFLPLFGVRPHVGRTFSLEEDLTSFFVAQRTREIGVRMALGATHGRIMRMTLASAGVSTVAGLVIGTAGSFAVAQVIRSLLFQVQPRDPVAMGAAILVLGLVVLGAAAIPAHRATHVDPASSLREP